MNLPFILFLAIQFPLGAHAFDSESWDAETWKPFEHPTVSERSFTAFSFPGQALNLVSGAMGFFKVESVHFSQGDRIPGVEGEWIPAVVVDASIERAQRKTLELRLELAQSGIERALLSKERADSAAELANIELERIRVLEEKGDASKSLLDQWVQKEQELRVAAAELKLAVEDARISARLVESEIMVLDEKIKQSSLLVPAGWYVERVDVVPGSGLTMGSQIMTLVDRSFFKAIVPMSEDEIQALSNGSMKLTRVLDGQRVKLKSLLVDSVPDLQTNRRRVTISIPAEEFTLLPEETGGGLELRISLEVKDAKGGVRIPTNFLRQRLEQWIVQDTSGKVYPVIPVRKDGSSWIVLPGQLPVGVELVAPAGS